MLTNNWFRVYNDKCVNNEDNYILKFLQFTRISVLEKNPT